MRFAEAGMLWLLLALPLLGVAAWAAAVRRRRAIEAFAGGPAHLDAFRSEVGRHRRATRVLLLLAAAAFGILAAARPQWGTRVEPVTRKGVDVAIVLDTSASMSARDVPPDRFGLARQDARLLLDRLAGDRVALVTFAGRGTTVCPLTPDVTAAGLFLDTIEPDDTSAPGTALADAVRAALQALGPASSSRSRGRAVVLLSDGEDHEGTIDEAVESLRSAGVTVLAVGCGTPDGAPIPAGDGGYKKDRSDKVVTTRLEEDVLQKLAVDTGGRVFRASAGGAEIEEIAHTLAGMESSESATVLRARYEERYQIPLGIALAALAGEALLPDRTRPARRRKGEA